MTSSTTSPTSRAPMKSDKKSDVSTTKPEASTKATVPVQETKKEKKAGSANPISTFAAGMPDMCGIL
ncbi:hypothetical protein FANTH_11654 [Fusarium anthophilum]|uniref:Uncharacterized protein n=1 Tax=Fusarium anthophilum TaxID=48485 RepID=A0A8H4YXH4_9HYPO|nr:hypothetical protein FANTH_11654 [Fusarium anthophilum]